MTDTSINAFNLKIRQTPWYQQWFAQKGLNPNRVQLNEQQRKELKGLVEANTGFVLPGDMKIDPAGNLNEKGGWAGLPIGVKLAIIGGATIATAGTLGAFAGPAAGVGAGGGAGASAGTIGAIGTAAIPAVAAPAATAGGIGLSGVLTAALSPAIGTIGSIYANRAASGGARDAAAAQTQSANYAADLEARGAADQLAFLREQEAQRRKEFEQVQAQNLALHNEETGYTRGLDSRRYEDLAPYRGLGIGAIGQLARPIRNIRQGRA